MRAGELDLEGMLRRLHLPTIRRLYAELEQRAEREQMSHRDYLAVLVAEEIAHRAQTRITRSVRKAKFPFLGTIEDFDFTFQSSLRLQLLGSFLGPELVSEGRNLLLSGPTGTGKTRLTIGVAYRAIQNGFEARFVTAAALIEELSNAARTGRLAEALHAYTHPHVLVIDEIGYLSLRDNAANVLFQVVNERYLQRRPMLFTTNKPLAAWGQVLHDPDLAEAILDRVLERGRHIELRGPSYRTRHLQKKENSSVQPSTDPGAIFSGTGGAEFPEPTVADAQRGPASAVNALLSALRPALVSYYGWRIDGDLADDLAQAALLRVHGTLPGIEPERADAFIATIARNVLRSGYAQRGRAIRRWAPEQFAEEVAVPTAADRHLEYQELARAVHEVANSALTPQQREIVLGLLREESPAEIAARLKISPITVRTRLQRARAALRRELRPYLDANNDEAQDRTG